MDKEIQMIIAKWGKDVHDLRDMEDRNSKPLDIRILLTPFLESDSEIKPDYNTYLRITCCKDYPVKIPKLKIENPHISTNNNNELMKILKKRAKKMRGKTMLTFKLIRIAKNYTIEQYFDIPVLKCGISRLKTEYEVLNVLGKGAFGEVVQVKNKLDNYIYAIKQVDLYAKDRRSYKNMTKEVELMSTLTHENIVQYNHSWIEEAFDADIDVTASSNDSLGYIALKSSTGKFASHTLCIQMEFCAKGTLEKFLKFNRVTPGVAKRIFHDILNGICYLHENGIMHRDLKPANILIAVLPDGSFRAKIADLGLATKFKNKKLRGRVGTPLYAAPEVMEGVAYNQKADIYSLGIILFVMVYSQLGTSELYDAIENLRKQSLIIPDSMLNDSNYKLVTEVIRQLLNHDAHKRPSAEELRNELAEPIEKKVKNLEVQVQRVFYKHNGVKSQSGAVVIPSSKMRASFFGYVAQNNIKRTRQYSIYRVPKENSDGRFYEQMCQFYIFSQKNRDHFIDAEPISMAFEIINDRLRDQNVIIRLNHTSLIRAVLVHCKVPPAHYSNLFRYIRAKLARQPHSGFNSKLRGMNSSDVLHQILLSSFVVNDEMSIADAPALQHLLIDGGAVASWTKQAIRAFKDTITIARNMGVTSPIHVCPGLAIGDYPTSFRNLMWQIIINPDSADRPIQVAEGTRYDNTLQKYVHGAKNLGDLSCAGLTLSLDKLKTLSSSCSENLDRALNVYVYATKDKHIQAANILKDLWSSDIPAARLEVASRKEAEDCAKQESAICVFIEEDNHLSVCSWKNNNCEKHTVTHNELIQCIQSIDETHEEAKGQAIFAMFPKYENESRKI